MTTMLRAYLVDDEELALKRLRRLLEATGRVEVAASATDPETALEFLSAHHVDALFLDIQMPGMNGFELLSRLANQPMVIFTTAFDQYALQAFEVNSIDYLLKPVEPQQLERALNKLERLHDGSKPDWMRQPDFRALLEELSRAIRAPQPELSDRIAARVGERLQVIPLARVTHFFARDKLIYAAADGKNYCVDFTITELEQKLDARQFLRIHRSTLLNLAWLEDVHSWFASQVRVRLKDQKRTELTVARDRVRVLRQRLGL